MTTLDTHPPVRLSQRDDGHDTVNAHARLAPAGDVANRPTSTQNGHAPRVGEGSTYS